VIHFYGKLTKNMIIATIIFNGVKGSAVVVSECQKLFDLHKSCDGISSITPSSSNSKKIYCGGRICGEVGDGGCCISNMDMAVKIQ